MNALRGLIYECAYNCTRSSNDRDDVSCRRRRSLAVVRKGLDHGDIKRWLYRGCAARQINVTEYHGTVLEWPHVSPLYMDYWGEAA